MKRFLIVLLILSFSLYAQEDADSAVKPKPVPKYDTFQKKDSSGRNYELRAGKVTNFFIDDDYYEVYPDVDEWDVHLAESRELLKKKKIYSYIRLLKSMSFCKRLLGKNRKSLSDSKEVEKNLGSVLTKEKLNSNEIEILTEPYGCYAKAKNEPKKLYLESQVWGYSLAVDSGFTPYFKKNALEFTGKEKDYSWEIKIFAIQYNATSKDLSLERKYFEAENGFLSQEKKGIYLSISTSYHFYSLENPENYIGIWDYRRGLTQAGKGSIQFTRTKLAENEFKEEYYTTSSQGISTKVISYSKTSYKNNRGVNIVLSFPEEFNELGSTLWSETRKTIR